MKIKRILGRAISAHRAESSIKSFFKDVEHDEPAKKRILMYVGIGSMYMTPIEILLYHLLKKRSVDVDYMVYDESIPICEIVTQKVEKTEGKERFWRSACKHAKGLLRAGKVQYLNISIDSRAEDLVGKLNSIEEVLRFKYDDIDFGDIVEGALYRYYKSLSFGDDAESVARRMLITSLSNYFCVKSRFDIQKYDVVLMSHGIYVTWQPVVEYCQKNGIKFVCYDRAKTQDCGNFNVGQPSPNWSFDTAWERYADRTLTTEEEQDVDSYLQDRELQKGDVYSYNFSGRAADIEREKERLGIPLNKKCVVIYTNLIWDAANVSRDLAFDSAYDCILKTVDYFESRADVQVVVRCHPAEKVLGTSEKYSQLLKDHYGGRVPKNLTIIAPEDDVNSFTMIDITTVGVINTSTVGLEIAMMGKPAVIISETHYRSKGFTVDVNSAEEYFTSLDGLLLRPNISSEQRNLARKYFYMMMFLYQKRLPSRYLNGVFQGYSVKRFQDLNGDEDIENVADIIATGLTNDFILWPDDSASK